MGGVPGSLCLHCHLWVHCELGEGKGVNHLWYSHPPLWFVLVHCNIFTLELALYPASSPEYKTCILNYSTLWEGFTDCERSNSWCIVCSAARLFSVQVWLLCLCELKMCVMSKVFICNLIGCPLSLQYHAQSHCDRPPIFTQQEYSAAIAVYSLQATYLLKGEGCNCFGVWISFSSVCFVGTHILA